MPIDPRLTVDCDKPELMGDTWRDIGALAVERGAALEECTDRMRVIRSESEKAR